MNQTEQFLALYKDYETIVRSTGKEPMDIENSSDEITMGRLRLCRQFRNYLCHNNDVGFIEPTTKMIAFLKQQYQSFVMQGDIVKKHLKTPAASICNITDKCVVALEKMCKLESVTLPVYDAKNGKYGVVSLYDIVKAVGLSKTAKLSDIKQVKAKISIVAPSTLMSEIEQDIITICTADGTIAGKCLGTIYF